MTKIDRSTIALTGRPQFGIIRVFISSTAMYKAACRATPIKASSQQNLGARWGRVQNMGVESILAPFVDSLQQYGPIHSHHARKIAMRPTMARGFADGPTRRPVKASAEPCGCCDPGGWLGIGVATGKPICYLLRKKPRRPPSGRCISGSSRLFFEQDGNQSDESFS
jgi:hypothetical protein